MIPLRKFFFEKRWLIYSEIFFFSCCMFVHWSRFENLTILLGSYKNNILKISHSKFWEFLSYSPIRFVFFFKSRLLFNVSYCFCMFVNKHFAYWKCTYLKKWKVLSCAICVIVCFIWRWMYCKIFISALVYL